MRATQILAFFLLLPGAWSSAVTHFWIESDYTDPVKVWYWPLPNHDQRWHDPETLLTPKRNIEKVELASGRVHYVLVTDPAINNKEHVGNVDFDSLVAKFSSGGKPPTFVISELFAVEQRVRTVRVNRHRPETKTVEYTVSKMVPEERTRTIRCWNRRLRKWVEVTKNYIIMKRVQETRTREYTVQVPYVEEIEVPYTVRIRKPKLRVRVNGELIDIEDAMDDSATD